MLHVGFNCRGFADYEIKGHENETIKLVTRVNCDLWYSNSYNNYIKFNMYIHLSQYLVEKRLVFQIKE